MSNVIRVFEAFSRFVMFLLACFGALALGTLYAAHISGEVISVCK
jgi:hypothetical protein